MVMAASYSNYFTLGQHLQIAIRVSEKELVDLNCIVKNIENSVLTLELSGEDIDRGLEIDPGTDVFVTSWTGWALCRCKSVLAKKISKNRVILNLTGPIIEKQTREHFRLDVLIPVSHFVPDKQWQIDLKRGWSDARTALKKTPPPMMRSHTEGLKVVRWNGGEDILPQRVNLSAGGLKMKTQEPVKSGTMVAVNLFLPLSPPKVICTVAETLRSHEIILSLGKGTSFITAMRFYLLDEKDRETIIAFLFSEQRRMLNINTGLR